MNPIKIGFLKLESCNGCVDRLLSHKHLNIILEEFEFMEYPFAGDIKPDFILVEGSAVTKKQMQKLENVKGEKNIILFGTCAKTPFHLAISSDVRDNLSLLNPNHVLAGCPPSNKEMIDFLCSLRDDKRVSKLKNPVCKECAEKEVRCILLDNKKCDGPDTEGGCEVLCPTSNVGCHGCRGKILD